MALDDPNKMNPMILSAKMEGAVKEHSGLTDSSKMLTNRCVSTMLFIRHNASHNRAARAGIYSTNSKV